MGLTVKQIQQAQCEYAAGHGGDDNSLQAKYYARPVSYLLVWLLARTAVKPNHVSVIALLAGVAGGLYIMNQNLLVGALLLNISHLLDYADGTLAKATGTVSKYGAWLDNICDDIVETAIPISVGVALINTNALFVIIGVFCAIIHLWGSLASTYARIRLGDSPSSAAESNKFRYLVSVGTNMKSLAVPSLLVFIFIPHGLPIFLVMLTILNTCEFIIRMMSVKDEQKDNRE